MHAITWRANQNKKAATPIERLSMPDYLTFKAQNKFWTWRRIILGIAIFVFFLLAMGLAGRADLEVMQALN
mgnify:CR=1 FL=1